MTDTTIWSRFAAAAARTPADVVRKALKDL